MRYLLIAATLLGCMEVGDRVTKVQRPDGQVWFSTSCRHKTECFKDADFTCPGGYHEADDGQSPTGLLFRCSKGNANY